MAISDICFKSTKDDKTVMGKVFPLGELHSGFHCLTSNIFLLSLEHRSMCNDMGSLAVERADRWRGQWRNGRPPGNRTFPDRVRQ